MNWILRRNRAKAEAEDGWSWRALDKAGEWLTHPESGSLDRFADRVRQRTGSVILLLPATAVTTRRLDFTAAERRHLTRIVPFMLEEQLATAPEQLHFALGQPSKELVAVSIADKSWFAQQLQDVEAHDIEVSSAVSEALVLKVEPGTWTLFANADEVCVHLQEGQGFAVEHSLLLPAMRALMQQFQPPTHARLITSPVVDAGVVRSLADSLRQLDSELRVTHSVSNFWDSVSLELKTVPDLRQGEFAARLPLHRYWNQFRAAAMVAVAAVIVWIAVGLIELQVLNRQQENLQAQITTLYREVMPQGLLVNAEAQLRNQLTQLSGSVNGESVLTLLSSFAGALQNGDGVTLHRINYNQKSNDMQVVMAASNNANLLKFIDRMEQAGLVASAQNMTRTGEEQQATVIVSRRML